MKSKTSAIFLVSLACVALVAFACQKSDAISSITFQPGDDVMTAVAGAPEGWSFHFKPGIYRMQAIKPKNGQKFIGQTGAILSGAKRLDTWKQVGSNWVSGGVPEPLHRSGYCDEGFELCTYREDLFVDGKVYRRVESLEKLGPDRWFGKEDKAYIQIDPKGRTVELGVTPFAFAGSATAVTIQNFIVEKYASEAQHGAIEGSASRNWRIIDVVARWNHGGGLQLGQAMTVQGGAYSYNGQIGMVGEGDGALIDGVEIAFNNYANYNWGWEAGGTKFWRSDGLVVRNSCVHDNNGPGLWTDIDNINTLYENNVVFGNDGDGIKHEISYKATIRKNRVGLNGKGKDNWMWGSQILIQNSSNVEVYENTIEVPAKFGNGIGLINQERGTGAHGAWVTTNNSIHDNTVIYLAGRGVSGIVTDINLETFSKDKSNLFDHNTYVVTEKDQPFWRDWDGDATWYNLSDSYLEKHGKLLIETRAPTILKCDAK